MRGGVTSAAASRIVTHVPRLILIAALPLLVGCAHHATSPPAREPRPSAAAPAPRPAAPRPRVEARPKVEEGYATWYGQKLAGHRTADGGVFDPRRMTAAHRTLPLGTWVEVTCIDTGARVRVKITDRGPFGHADRIIDLSRAAADKLGIRRRGLARVSLRVVHGP